MGFKLTKDEEKQRTNHIKRLNDAYADLSGAISAFNDTLSDELAKLQTAYDQYNQSAIIDARAFCENVAARLDTEYDNKSEAWQEGARGQDASSFRDEWLGAEIEELECPYIEDITTPDNEALYILEALPSETEDA